MVKMPSQRWSGDPRRLGWVPARTLAPKGATQMYAVSSAFNRAGFAFFMAVVILTLL